MRHEPVCARHRLVLVPDVCAAASIERGLYDLYAIWPVVTVRVPGVTLGMDYCLSITGAVALIAAARAIEAGVAPAIVLALATQIADAQPVGAFAPLLPEGLVERAETAAHRIWARAADPADDAVIGCCVAVE